MFVFKKVSQGNHRTDGSVRCGWATFGFWPEEAVTTRNSWLDDVSLLIAQAAPAATPAQAATWLNYAEMALDMAVRERIYVQEVIAKFGPDAVTVGG